MNTTMNITVKLPEGLTIGQSRAIEAKLDAYLWTRRAELKELGLESERLAYVLSLNAEGYAEALAAEARGN